MKSFLSSLRKLDSSTDVLRDRQIVNRQYQLFTTLLLSSAIIGSSIELIAAPATAAPTRKDWCSSIWSVDNFNSPANNVTSWINPSTGITTAAPTLGPGGITTPSVFPNPSTVAGLGLHAESGTLYAFDRNGSTGTFYKYKLGTDTSWQTVTVSGLVGFTGTASFPGSGASNNLNKITTDGNTLYIAESAGFAIYSIPLNANGTLAGNATATQYSFSGDPIGTPSHSAVSFYHNLGNGDPKPTDPIGSTVMNGGDLAVDEYGDVYNVTYNVVLTDWTLSNNTWIPTTKTDKAYFYKQSGTNWVYQGETAATANFAGAAFYKGGLYVKSATQLYKVPLERTTNGYSGWNNTLEAVGSPSPGYSSGDLAACGTPDVTMTKTQQIYADAALTTLVADQTKVKTGQYIKYTITAKNMGSSWAKNTTITDILPTGTTYVADSASLNGTSLGFTTYPTSGFVINAPGSAAGIVPYSTVAGSDTATMSFVVQVTALTGAVQNQATVAYIDNAGLPSEPISCTAPLLNCGITPSAIVEVDYGDAPSSYGSASHTIVSSIHLGPTITAESAAYNSPLADGDTDDGITSFPTLTAGATSYSIPAANITTTGTGTLHAWIDFNKNGTFESGEHTSVAVTSNTLAGDLNWTGITAGAAGNTFARFRFTSDSSVTASTPSGIATDGEVEDYSVVIAAAPPPPITSGASYCASPYGEVYATRGPNTLYAVHGPTGASTLLTTSTILGSSAAINGMGTDHVNKLVYYADANGIYAWNALENTHITVTDKFKSFLPSSYQGASPTKKFNSLSSGGAAFYNGSFYVGVDGNANSDFEIFKVDFTPNGQLVTAVTPLDVVGKSAIGNLTGGLQRTDEDWGDFTISDTGMILGLSNRYVTNVGTHIWNYDLNAAAGTNPYANLGASTGNHQLAKSGDGKLWALFSNSKVQEITAAGSYVGAISQTAFGPSDAGECVVGNATVGDRVWTDTNGDGIQDAGELGIVGASVSIYRDLNKNGVLDTGEPLLATQVTGTDGIYNFTELLPHDPVTGTGHNDFIVKVTPPAGMVATTPITKAVDLNSASQIISTVDFGFNRLPETTDLTPPSQTNPGGSATVVVPTLAGTDPEDGTLGTGNKFKIVSLPTNGILYYPNASNVPTAVTAGQTISNYDPTKLTLDPQDGAISAIFTYSSIDAAGKEDPTPAKVTMEFSAAVVTGGGPNFCASPYGEVYATRGPNTLYAVHGPTGASTLLTTSTILGSSAAINGMGTDHVNKLVYYADANGIYAWNALENTHITVTDKFKSFLPSSYQGASPTKKFNSLSSGGAAFYNGSFYVGVDGNTNSDFEIFKVDFTPNGQLVTAVTPLDVVGKSAIGNLTGGLQRTDEDWGDFTISDTGMILGLSNRYVTNVGTHIWNYDLNAAAGTNPYANLGASTGNHQLAKSGDGKLWALFSNSKVQEITAAGSYVGAISQTAFGPTDAGECVVGNATVGDRVWTDTNGDGIQDAGELGIVGASVSIYRDLNKNGVLDTGEPLLATQVTGTDGIYNFTELLPHDPATGTGHNDFIVKVTPPAGMVATTPITKAIDLESASQIISTVDFGFGPSKAKVLIVKRITAIKAAGATTATKYNTFDTTSPALGDDRHCNWPLTTNVAGACTNNYILGKIDAGLVKPGDEIEYTIYYLNAGGNKASQARICDQLDRNLSFNTAFDADPTHANQGITLVPGIPGVPLSTDIQYLTNLGGDDKGELATAPVAGCNLAGNTGTNLSTDVVVVDVADPAITTNPLMGSTGAGIPTTSYGYIRFKATVK